MISIQAAMEEALKELSHSFSDSGRPILKTGQAELDQAIMGLHPGTLTLVAEHNAMVSHSFVFDVAMNAALNQKASVGYFGLELMPESLTKWMLCELADIDVIQLEEGVLDEEGFKQFNKAFSRLQQTNIFFNESLNLNIARLESKASQLDQDIRATKSANNDAELGEKASSGLDLIVIDNLALLSGKEGPYQTQSDLVELGYGLKNLAIELSVPVLASVPWHLEGKGEQCAPISGLGEYGCVGHYASLVLLSDAESTCEKSFYLGANRQIKVVKNNIANRLYHQ